MSDAERKSLLKKIKSARNRMHETAMKYGIGSTRTLEVSQELDLLINRWYK